MNMSYDHEALKHLAESQQKATPGSWTVILQPDPIGCDTGELLVGPNPQCDQIVCEIGDHLAWSRDQHVANSHFICLARNVDLQSVVDEIERLNCEADGYAASFDAQHEEIERCHKEIKRLESERVQYGADCIKRYTEQSKD